MPEDKAAYNNLDGLFASMNSYMNKKIVPWLTTYSQVPQKYNVKLLCYEAGNGLTPSDYPGGNYSLLLAAQLDQRMGEAHLALAKAMENAGVCLCMINDDCDGWAGRWGFWGLVTNILETLPGGNPPPKFTACVNLARAGTQNEARMAGRGRAVGKGYY